MPEPTAAAPARVVVPDRIRRFLDAPRVASLATIDPDGAPRQTVVWYRLEGDDILVNSRVGRRWPSNLGRDGRTSISIVDQEDGYSWIGLTAEVISMDDDHERALGDIQDLARRYKPDDPSSPASFVGQSRVTYRLRILGIHDHLEE
jgi:PPOX class probable F420-dependent enzyme